MGVIIMKNLDLTTVEEMLKGRISKNPNRFEEANGIVFSVNEMTEEIEEYFNGHGVEFYKLVNGIYYTETVMSVGEFSNLNHLLHYKQIA
jgi:hypothetical protein